MNRLYPVPREEGDGLHEPRSAFIGGRLPNPDASRLFFLRPLRGIQHEVAAVVASFFIVVPTVAPEAAPTPLKPLVATQIVEAEEPRPSSLIRVPFADLLPRLDRPLSGYEQTVEEFGLSRIIRVPFASPTEDQKLLFQRPLAGIEQPLADIAPSVFVRVPTADFVPPPPFVLFQHPLAGIVQPEPDLLFQSILIGQRLPFTSVPLNVLFQRPLIAILQPEAEFGPSRILRVPVADAPPPPINVLFQHPLIGVEQSLLIVEPSRIIRVPFPDPAPPALDLFFLRPLRNAFLVAEAEPEFASVLLFGLEPERDVLFLRRLTGVSQPDVVVPPSRIIRVPVADVPPTPISVLFQRPLAGFVQPILEVDVSRVIRVIIADVPPTPINVLFQRPLIGIVQPIIIVPSSRIIVVTPADVIPPVSQQRNTAPDFRRRRLLIVRQP